jgi:hypothetical protein
MNVSEEDLTTLKEALIKGEREVSINDKKIVYRSVTELREAIYEIEIRLQRAKAQRGRGVPAVRQIRLTTRKGF